MSARPKRNHSFWFMTVAALMTLSAASVPALAQNPPDQQPQQSPGAPEAPQPPAQPLTQQQLQQMVAPIALYPDPLLAQVLTASTYPLEVTLAARWAEQNPNVKDQALEDAMQKEPWDPSVKGLTAVPQVLAMMNAKLDWTVQLGEAFLAQPDDIQTAIQGLRRQAEATGNLKSSKEQRVSRVAAPANTGYAGPPEYVVIEPAEPDYVYVPVYDPVVVYGPGFWAPAYTPFFWYPGWWTVGPVFGFAAAAFVGPALWYHYNWGYHGYAAIRTNTALYGRFNRVNVSGGQFQNWKFNAAHHANVQFKNANLQRQFGNGTNGARITTGKTLQGLQKGAAIQGTQTGKGLGNGNGRNGQGLGTGKNQGTGTGKNIQGTKTSNLNRGTQNKNFQGNQTGNRGPRVQTSNRVQTFQGGGGNRGQGGGGNRGNRAAAAGNGKKGH